MRPAPLVAIVLLGGAGCLQAGAPVACDGEAGRADAVLALTARAEQGAASVVVRDGVGRAVHERHLAPNSGLVDTVTTITGAPGRWAVEESRSEAFRGELDARLSCA